MNYLAHGWRFTGDPVVAGPAWGIVQHHADDDWFHQKGAFSEPIWSFTVAVRDRLPKVADPVFPAAKSVCGSRSPAASRLRLMPLPLNGLFFGRNLEWGETRLAVTVKT
jgi:hypothetical protein